jgi:hypothetical protein
MRDISCFVSPIPDHAFFEQAVFEREVGDDFLQGLRDRRSFTSSEVAARAVSPASRFLPASKSPAFGRPK